MLKKKKKKREAITLLLCPHTVNFLQRSPTEMANMVCLEFSLKERKADSVGFICTEARG